MTGAPTYNFQIGTSGGTLLSTLGIPWPRDEFVKYPVVKELVNGGVRGMGLPQIEWNWDLLQGVEYNRLLAFKGTELVTPGIWVESRDEDNAFTLYSGDMIWPQQIQWSAGRVLKFKLIFKNLVED